MILFAHNRVRILKLRAEYFSLMYAARMRSCIYCIPSLRRWGRLNTAFHFFRQSSTASSAPNLTGSPSLYAGLPLAKYQAFPQDDPEMCSRSVCIRSPHIAGMDASSIATALQEAFTVQYHESQKMHDGHTKIQSESEPPYLPDVEQVFIPQTRSGKRFNVALVRLRREADATWFLRNGIKAFQLAAEIVNHSKTEQGGHQEEEEKDLVELKVMSRPIDPLLASASGEGGLLFAARLGSSTSRDSLNLVVEPVACSTRDHSGVKTPISESRKHDHGQHMSTGTGTSQNVHSSIPPWIQAEAQKAWLTCESARALKNQQKTSDASTKWTEDVGNERYQGGINPLLEHDDEQDEDDKLTIKREEKNPADVCSAASTHDYFFPDEVSINDINQEDPRKQKHSSHIEIGESCADPAGNFLRLKQQEVLRLTAHSKIHEYVDIDRLLLCPDLSDQLNQLKYRRNEPEKMAWILPQGSSATNATNYVNTEIGDRGENYDVDDIYDDNDSISEDSYEESRNDDINGDRSQANLPPEEEGYVSGMFYD